LARKPKLPPPPVPLVDETKPYPDTGPLAVLARVALILAAAALIYATIMPGSAVPKLFYSNNLEHFAAFYVGALTAAAAFPRRKLRWLTLAFGLFAVTLEGSRLIGGLNPRVFEMWSADFGGVMAAYAPMGVERFRRLFPRGPAR
jgi:hypothetical protein